MKQNRQTQGQSKQKKKQLKTLAETGKLSDGEERYRSPGAGKPRIFTTGIPEVAPR